MNPEEQVDEMFCALAAKLGGISPLLEAFFSFLNRKTDFYVTFPPAPGLKPQMGFAEGQAEQLVMHAFRRFPFRSLEAAQGKLQQAQRNTARPKARPKPARAPSTPAPPPAAAAAAAPQAAPTSTAASPAAVPAAPPSSAAAEADSPTPPPPTTSAQPAVRLSDKGKQVPVGNGGVTAAYFWTQSLYEVSVFADVPKGTRGSQIVCDIRPNALALKLQDSSEDIIRGQLPYTVRPEESVWVVEDDPSSDRGSVVITLDKIKKTWWASVVDGDPEIDTSLVDSVTVSGRWAGARAEVVEWAVIDLAVAGECDTRCGLETCKVDEYDAETQGAIRKIMFDQKQKALGLPTSDDLAQQELLDKAKFMPGSPFLPPEQGGAGWDQALD